MVHGKDVGALDGTGKATRRRKLARADAGWAFRHTAPMQKHLTALVGLDKSTVSRMCSGEKPSDVSRFYDLVRAAVRESRTDAGYLIAGALLIAENEAAKLPLPEIVARLKEALSQETWLQAEEDIAEQALAFALGCLAKDSPTAEELATLRAALVRHDEAVRGEMGREVDSIIYNRALRVVMGWRAAP